VRDEGKKNTDRRLLDGIKVADFSWAGVGPLTTKFLSDYGAEVIKIESSTRPGLLRTAGPFKESIQGLNRGGIFNQWNTNKLSVALNLASPKGVEVAKRLVAWADIVVENFAGGVMRRMGLSYEELSKIKPDIIMLSSCMQGQTGQHSSHPGFGDQPTALAGFNHITGWPNRDPVWISAYTDWVAPLFNCVIVLAALDYRRRTGKGQYIDSSQYENGIHFISPLILDDIVNQRVADRMGNSSIHAAPHNVYRCRGEDKWCAIAIFTDEEWRSFCRVIGNPAWTNDPKFSTLPARKENEGELNRLVEEWTTSYSPKEVMGIMQGAGIAAGVRQKGEDLLENDPQLKYRRYFQELDHPEIGKYRAPRPSFVLSKSSCSLRSAPLLGEHNEYVLKEVLHMSDEEIAELIIEGVIQ